MHITTRNEKANFRHQCSLYVVKHEKLYYQKKSRKAKSTGDEPLREVILCEDERKNILKIIHEGAGVSVEAKALSGHRGRDATQRLLRQRFFWPAMTHDAREYISECPVCQKVNPSSLKVVPDLQPISVPMKVMEQIGIDIIQLPESSGLKYAVVAIDYFSKWSEARALPDKRAETVARFIYEDIVCRHGCPLVQINDQGREFVNQVSEQLNLLTGVKQRITSAYHPQANGLVERQNRTIKNCLLKVLEENSTRWPDILQGVLFAHRSAVHSSTKYSPFYIMYQREPVLPVDVYRMNVDEASDSSMSVANVYSEYINEDIEDQPFDNDHFCRVLDALLELRNVIHSDAKVNIDDAQSKQKHDYNRRHSASHVYKVGDKVLLKNLRRSDRKGGWHMMPWLGPYSIAQVHLNKMVSLHSLRGNTILQARQHLRNIKPFRERSCDEEFCKENECTEIDVENDSEVKDENKKDSKSKDVGKKIKVKKDTRMKKRNKTDNEKEEMKVTEDCEIVNKDTDSSDADQSVSFFPIDEHWQKLQCKRFGLKFIKAEPEPFNIPILLTQPFATEKIRGDGNCWFRSLSVCITGSESSHLAVRKRLCEYMAIDDRVQGYVGSLNIKQYIKQQKMMNNRTWATDTEIFASALMLETDIYVFLNGEWQHFSKTGRLSNKPDKFERCVYINNVSSCHYEVVRSVHK